MMSAVQPQAKLIGNPWKALFGRRSRPQLVITVLMPFFQQFTGINAARPMPLSSLLFEHPYGFRLEHMLC